MTKFRFLTSALLISALISSAPLATAATAKPTPKGACTSLGAMTTISGKSYVCKLDSKKKKVWTLTPTLIAPPSSKPAISPSAKPSLTGRPSIGGGTGEGQDDEGSLEDLARHDAMDKYQACLQAHGSTLTGRFGLPRPNDDDHNADGGTPLPTKSGAPSINPNVQPSLSAKDQAAVKACASLAPTFGRGGDRLQPTRTPTPQASIKVA